MFDMDVFIGYSSSLLKYISSQGNLSIQVFMETGFKNSRHCISMPLNDSLAENMHSYLNSSVEIPCIRRPN